jgi:hypothetical protein
MFGRDRDVAVGDYMRRTLEPMLRHVDIDFNTSFFNPPRTDPALAVDVYRCGLSLLMAFTEPGGWSSGRGSRKTARKAARRVRVGLHGERGPHAISHMAQGYAAEMGAFWRRAATAPTSYPDEILRLTDNANRSESLGKLAGEYWPVTDPFNALNSIAEAERHRFFDADNPDAMIDLLSYAGRVRATCEAVTLALGDAFEEYDSLLIAPVMSLDLEFASGLQADWVFQLEHWTNLLSDEPLSYCQFLQISNAAHGYS